MQSGLDDDTIAKVVTAAEVHPMKVDAEKVALLDRKYLSAAQVEAVEMLTGTQYTYRWQLESALAAQTDDWKMRDGSALNKLFNKKLGEQLGYLESTFAFETDRPATRRLH